MFPTIRSRFYPSFVILPNDDVIFTPTLIVHIQTDTTIELRVALN
jgi:hypothetical protein